MEDKFNPDFEKISVMRDKNKTLKKEYHDLIENLKNIEENYNSSIKNMQVTYEEKKNNFDKESSELEEKQKEIREIQKNINSIEEHFRDTSEIIKMKQQQKDIFDKMTNVLEKNYQNYLSHINELNRIFEEKFIELKRLKINSKNMSQIMIDSYLEKNELLNAISQREKEMEQLKNECKKLKEKKNK